MINPEIQYYDVFGYDFDEQRSMTTLTTQGNAKYNKVPETVEQKTALENFFEQNVPASPNPQHPLAIDLTEVLDK